MGGIVNKTGQVTANAIRDAARIVNEETNEIVKSATEQIVGAPKAETPRVEVNSSNPTSSVNSKAAANEKVVTKRRLTGLQEELAKMAEQQRLAKVREANQREILQSQKEESEKKPGFLPIISSHRSRNPMEQNIKHDQGMKEYGKTGNG